MPFEFRDYEEIEKAYKRALQGETFVYRDSHWLQTEADLPVWEEYRRQIVVGLEDTLAHRAALNAIYAEWLPTEVQLPPAYQTWRFNIRVKDKDCILAAIFAAGLFASSHYASLAGVMAPGSCPWRISRERIAR